MRQTDFNPATPNFRTEAARKIAQLFPEVVADGQINFDALQESLSPDLELDGGTEKFGFMWRGKRDAKKIADMPARNTTLIPNKKKSKNWDTTKNVYIEGDNLEVLKLLQKAYAEKIKLIYLDPPYNTGNDFVYHDNFHDSYENYLKQTGQIDFNGNATSTNRESNGRFHTDWLNMMFPRLKLARNLLRDDGIIFVSIDDNESYNLRNIMNEIFGESNFLSDIIWEKRFTRSNNARTFSSVIDHILVYRKSPKLDYLREPRNEKSDSIYSNPDHDPRGVWTSVSYVNPATANERPNLVYPVTNPITGESINHPTNAWKYSEDTYHTHVKENRLYWGKNGENTYPRLKKFLSDSDGMVPTNLWNYKEVGTTDGASKDLNSLMNGKMFDFPKPVSLIQKIISIATKEDDLVLDFFSGSSTTAEAVMQQNQLDSGTRNYIMVQLPEKLMQGTPAYAAGYRTISDIAEGRIDLAGKRLYSRTPNCQVDIGFRTFSLSESTITTWSEEPDQFTRQLEMLASSPFTEHSTNEQRAYEIALKLGVTLTTAFMLKNNVYHFASADQEVFIALSSYDSRLFDYLNSQRSSQFATVVLKELPDGSETKFNLLELLKQNSEYNNHFRLEWL
ncbi:site-specific DNA-methyltransferase [Lacticaseibacillus pantheris]